MERINLFDFYRLGNVLSDLTRFREKSDVKVKDIVYSLYSAQWRVESLLLGSPFPLGVSRSAAENLKKSLDRIKENYLNKSDDEEDGATVSSPLSSRLKSDLRSVKYYLDTFETVFGAEMAESTTYFVPRRGIFFTPALVDDADTSFPKSVVEHIPEKARSDWKSAGRCLAFNLLSASGFHVARAVEATLERYYQVYTKTEEVLIGWGAYINKLEKLDGPIKPEKRTLAELSQMKDDFRNPIMHPRVSLTEGDARMLFNNGESLIILMAGEISNLEKNSPDNKTQLKVQKQAPSDLDDDIPF